MGGIFMATESHNYRVTDTQGYPVYWWCNFFVPDFNKLLYLLCSQGDVFYSDTTLLGAQGSNRIGDVMPRIQMMTEWILFHLQSMYE